MLRVAIIIVNWNGKADTLECLTSLRADIYPAKRIFVVDNGSADDSVTAINASFPEVTVLSTGANLGFTGGNNFGIEAALEAGCEYLFLLNNDTVVEPDAVSQLVAAAELNQDAGILTPQIHYFDAPDEAWFSGAYLDMKRAVALHDNSAPPDRNGIPRPVPWASGCAMLIPRHVIENAGGFDDRFFLNWEDVDLSIRIANSGYTILMVPAARIRHKVGRTLGTVSAVAHYYYVRNHFLIARLYGSRAYPLLFLSLSIDHIRHSAGKLLRRRSNAAAIFKMTLRAIVDSFRKRYGALVA